MPINLFALILFLIFPSTASATAKQKYTIMIDPAGDIKQTGRSIDNSLERAITLKIADALQHKLTKQSCCAVIITRSPGEIIPPLQNANFANRLPINLYISLHCYSNPQENLSLTLYQFSYHAMPIHQSNDLCMVPYDKAHLKSYDNTQTYAKNIKTALTNTKPSFLIQGIYAIPFYPLIGIQAPSIGIEMNNIKEADWQIYVNPLAESIISVLETV